MSFLHVYHHSSITIITAISAQYDVAGDLYLAALLNSWIHVRLQRRREASIATAAGCAPLPFPAADDVVFAQLFGLRC